MKKISTKNTTIPLSIAISSVILFFINYKAMDYFLCEYNDGEMFSCYFGAHIIIAFILVCSLLASLAVVVMRCFTYRKT